MESTDISPQAIDLNPSCSGQAHSNRPGTGHGYESTEPECILTLLCIPYIICPLRSQILIPPRLITRFHADDTKGHLDLIPLGEHVRTHLKDNNRND